jgi:CubicO group peptidase (beta-lactamase class C family)
VAPRIELAWAPGTRVEYSNVGYALLGRLIETVSGQPYDEFCSHHVLTRYGLTNTRLPSPTQDAPATVTGHQAVAGTVAAVTRTSTPYPGAGGMSADTHDLLALADLLGQGTDPLVHAALDHAVPAGPGVRFAPGFTLLDRPAGTLIWRGGSTPGFTTEIVTAADGSASVVLLAATTPATCLRDLALDLLHQVQACART